MAINTQGAFNETGNKQTSFLYSTQYCVGGGVYTGFLDDGMQQYVE